MSKKLSFLLNIKRYKILKINKLWNTVKIVLSYVLNSQKNIFIQFKKIKIKKKNKKKLFFKRINK